MSRRHVSIYDRIKDTLCASCSKPIIGEEYHTVPSSKYNKEYRYHNTAQQCADADPLIKDWYRRHDRTQTYKRTKDRLNHSDGHKRDTDDDMSLWLDGVEY